MKLCHRKSAQLNGVDRHTGFSSNSYILVVDDSEGIRQILGEVLGNAGYSVLLACDGLEALAILEKYERAVSLVLLDRMMPHLDGLQVLTRMKRHPQWRDIPVIMQTSATSVEDVRTGIATGAFYYLTKPFHEEAVLGIVKATLEDAHQRYAWRQELQGEIQALGCMNAATFHIQTLEEIGGLAKFLARSCPDPDRVIVGLGDLMMNAVEHGNLEITFDEKTQLQREERWEDEIRHRLEREPFVSRYVNVDFTQTADWIHITIRDEGMGFDWKPFLEFDASLAFATHGRGIAMAKSMCFDTMEYQGIGNVVVCGIDKANCHRRGGINLSGH